MNKIFTLLLLLLVVSQTSIGQTSLYGEADTADLKMSFCSFEKDANAMVLFDVAKITYSKYEYIVMQRHKRVKIFNDRGKSVADVRIEYFPGDYNESIKNLEAQTINLVDNKIVITPIDKKSIYIQKVDKQRKAFVFTFPNVKPGSIIEYRYTWETGIGYNFPEWAFQRDIPTRYSELDAHMHFRYSFNIIKKATRKFALDTMFAFKDKLRHHIWAMKDVPAFRLEPYMHSIEDNLQGIYFKPTQMLSYWPAIARQIIADADFGGQLKLPLYSEADVVADAKALKTDNEKIGFLFNTVKNTVKWNNIDKWYTDGGIQAAWVKKTGNSTEINLILYHLLQLSGIKPTLLVLGKRESGEIELGNPSFGRLNKTVVRVPIDSVNFYVMDASGKYNTYNDTPYDLLGLNMLTIDPDSKDADVIKLKTDVPSKEIIFVNAQIKANADLEGNVQVSSSNYKRVDKLETWDKLKEKKYVDEVLKENNSNLQISNHKFTNLEVDTIPLREDFDFKLELTSSDENYIFFNPNLFTGIGINPFVNESRLADIDFIYLNTFSINGRYRLPAGYKIDALPKAMTIMMPDKSIYFKRVIGEFEGMIAVNYTIGYNKTKYTREEYDDLRQFYKKMYEMLNEQVVLKKG